MTTTITESTPSNTKARPNTKIRRPSWDTLLLAILVFSTLQIISFAEATLPFRLQDVLRHPLLGNILPELGETAMGEVGPRPG